MKLCKIYFDGYKSLLNKELTINHNCIGFVGTNESGKSNVLAAINMLGGDKKLSASDAPKMDKTSFPKIRYEFKLEGNEHQEFQNKINEWMKSNAVDCENKISIGNNSIFYTILFNKSTGKEERFFSIDNMFNIDDDVLILIPEKFEQYDNINYHYDVKDQTAFKHLTEVIAISKAAIQTNEKFQNESFRYENLLGRIENLDERINAIDTDKASIKQQLDEGVIDQDTFNSRTTGIDLMKMELDEEKKRLEDEVNAMEDGYEEFSVAECIQDVENDIEQAKQNIDKEKIKIAELNQQIGKLNKTTNRTPEQNAELDVANKNLKDSTEKVKGFESSLNQNVKDLPFYKEPLGHKYTKNNPELYRYIGGDFDAFLVQLIPKVVFWEYSANYILQSETSFAEILNKNNLSDISRPLVNLFRIGLGIKDIVELKQKINEIKNESHERSRINQILNSKINGFIQQVWQDYDQRIHITLEKDQIRIEIYDPNNDVNSSYYNMKERSQGCQTFLSFLMTIGAEAEHNVVNNIILLLDEPETHLHPSGVRFMLQELIKISERNNLVMYATHSIFLIDQNNLDRHIILKKNKEHTLISPANIGRIGYFMQEEVLYNTLDLNLGKDFSNHSKYNFVFEGDGDAYIFNHYYDKILKEDTRPYKLKLTSFQQGGKCSDIQKYFTQRPIQLGTKWIFILDKDIPADNLKDFFDSKYKDYIRKDIFIFQYSYTSNSGDVVLEDMLPTSLIMDVYISCFKQFAIDISGVSIDEIIKEKKAFNLYHPVLLKMVSDIDKDAFKASFKELLNSNLKTELVSKKDKETFSKYFSEYNKWVEKTIMALMPVKPT